MLVKLVDKQKNGAVKLGLVVRGKTRKGEDSTLPEEYIIYGNKVRRLIKNSGSTTP